MLPPMTEPLHAHECGALERIGRWRALPLGKIWQKLACYWWKVGILKSQLATQYTPSSTLCNILQHIATYCSILQHALQHTATHCNTLQHTATHCNILHHTATYGRTLQHTATHCNTLQHTATHCNILQHTATHCYTQCTASNNYRADI